MSRRRAAAVRTAAAVAEAPEAGLAVFYKAGGLVEREAAPGSPYRVLETLDGASPTPEQRKAMAERVQEHQGRGAYVQTRLAKEHPQPQTEESSDMTKKGQQGSTTEVVNVKEIQKAFDANRPEWWAAERQRKVDAAAKVKEEAAKLRAEAKARKARKGRDVTPKPTPAAPAAAAPAKDKGAKSDDPNQKFVVVKDNTRSGHMKVFMAKAAEMKKFTRAELISATKGKVTAERAERYFDYCLYKRLIGEAR